MNELDELLDMFRAAGGILDNATVDYSDEKGFLCKAVDPAHPVKMFCPDYLLVKLEKIGITENGLYIADWTGLEGHREFLERYFRYHINRELVQHFLEEEQEIRSIPQAELSALNRIGLPDFLLPGMPANIEGLDYARQRILAAHKIRHHSGYVIMPVISCVNHSKDGVPFDIKEEGIGVAGSFGGEIYAMYSRYDPIILYNTHRFISDTQFTYSLPINVGLPYGNTLAINNDYSNTTPDENGIRIPNLSVHPSGVLLIPWFPLHWEANTDYPVMIARFIEKHFVGHDVRSDSILNTAYKFNVQVLTSTLKVLRNSKSAYVKGAVKAVELQLDQIGK